MKMTPRIPAAATWLLKVFKVPERNPALAGDLTEEYAGGRGTAWLWRQVLAAIVFTVAREIYCHKLRMVGTVIAGEAAVVLSYFALVRASRSHWFAVFWVSSGLPGLGYWMVSIAVVTIVCMFGGWIVGRLHRDHRATFVVIFAALQLIWTMVAVAPVLRRHLVDSIDQARFRPYLALDLGILVLCPIAVVLGGYLAGSGADDRC
jgi:hypothetical protein